jgi:hypothetical protein
MALPEEFHYETIYLRLRTLLRKGFAKEPTAKLVLNPDSKKNLL